MILITIRFSVYDWSSFHVMFYITLNYATYQYIFQPNFNPPYISEAATELVLTLPNG